MKTALAILSVLLLTWAQAVAFGQPPGNDTVRVPGACCHHCSKACCSAAKSDQQSPAPSVPPTSSSSQQLLTIAPAIIAWILPGVDSCELTPDSSLPPTVDGAPLYARHCALLL